MVFFSWLVVMTVVASIAISLNSYNFSPPSGRPVSKVLYVTGLLYALVGYLIFIISAAYFFDSGNFVALAGVFVGVPLGVILGLCLEVAVFARLLKRNQNSLTDDC